MGRRPLGITFFPEDFADSMAVLTTEEFGALTRLVLLSVRQTPPCSLPNDNVLLARAAGLTVARWDEVRVPVLSAFGEPRGDRISCHWLLDRWESSAAYHNAKSRAGRQGGLASGEARREANAKQTRSRKEANTNLHVPVHVHVPESIPPPTPQPPKPPPVVASPSPERGGGWDSSQRAGEGPPASIPTKWCPGGVWLRAVAAKAIGAAYPVNRTLAGSVPKQVEAAIFALGHSGRFAGPWAEAEAAVYLLARATAYAGSRWVQTAPAGKVPGLATWLRDGLYDAPDTEWARAYPRENGSAPAYAPPTAEQVAAERAKEKAEREKRHADEARIEAERQADRAEAARLGITVRQLRERRQSSQEENAWR